MENVWKVVDILNIKIIGVGKLKEKYFKAGIAEYGKRLGRFCKFQVVEVPDEKAPESLSQAEMDEVMAKEGSASSTRLRTGSTFTPWQLRVRNGRLRSLPRRSTSWQLTVTAISPLLLADHWD